MTSQPFESGMTSFTVLYQDKQTTVNRGRVEGDDLWATLPDLLTVGGWEITPEGVCRDELCVPLPEGGSGGFLQEAGDDTWFNLSAFAQLVEQPASKTPGGDTWCFGPFGWEWKRALPTQFAQDFTLPDLKGNQHTLSDLRGKKVLLALWASW